jgi:type I restriction enzyme S subunit
MRLSNKLPLGWKWVKLGETCEIIMGQSPPSITYNIERDGIPFFQGKGDFGEIYPTARVWCKCPLKIARPGDVLISVRAPVGSVNIANDMSCIGRGLAALRPNNSLDVLWLFYYLRLHEDQISALGKGSTFSAITKTDLDSIFIPLPSLSEQKRILARINDLFSRIREAKRLRQEAQQEAERLWQSVLADTFPKPGTKLPNGWQWVGLYEVCQHKTGIWGPESSHPDQGLPIIRSTEIEGFLIRPQTASIRIVSNDRIEAFKLEAEDILVNKSSGSAHLVGWPAIFEGSIEGKIFLFSNFMLRLRPNREKILGWFLLYYLHNPLARSVYLRAQDTTSGLRNLRVNEFMKQLIPLPTLHEQHKIVAYLKRVYEKIQSLKEAQTQTEAELQRLEQAILDKAFRGEL